MQIFDKISTLIVDSFRCSQQQSSHFGRHENFLKGWSEDFLTQRNFKIDNSLGKQFQCALVTLRPLFLLQLILHMLNN